MPTTAASGYLFGRQICAYQTQFCIRDVQRLQRFYHMLRAIESTWVETFVHKVWKM